MDFNSYSQRRRNNIDNDGLKLLCDACAYCLIANYNYKKNLTLWTGYAINKDALSIGAKSENCTTENGAKIKKYIMNYITIYINLIY